MILFIRSARANRKWWETNLRARRVREGWGTWQWVWGCFWKWWNVLESVVMLLWLWLLKTTELCSLNRQVVARCSAHIFNPSSPEAEAGRALSPRPVCATERNLILKKSKTKLGWLHTIGFLDHSSVLLSGWISISTMSFWSLQLHNMATFIVIVTNT